MRFLTRLPGETVEEFNQRVVESAPPLTPELATRLARLLPLPAQTSEVAGGIRRWSR